MRKKEPETHQNRKKKQAQDTSVLWKGGENRCWRSDETTERGARTERVLLVIVDLLVGVCLGESSHRSLKVLKIMKTGRGKGESRAVVELRQSSETRGVKRGEE